MYIRHTVSRIVILLAAVLPAVLLSSCTDDGRETGSENRVMLYRDTVAYDHTGQFVSIKSSVDWSISLGYDGTEAGWAEVSPDEGSGDRNNVMLIYSENMDTVSRKVSLNVAFSDGEQITVTLVQSGSPGVPGDDSGSGSEPDPWRDLESDPYQSGWMELPAAEIADSIAFVCHRTEIAGMEKRNYSMLYDAGSRIALWVAYPLCSEYVGSGRTDAWGFDPKIPDKYEPVLNHGWPERGFDRGHQIPSGSRNANTDMNRQTFYYTNMTAQVSSFNQGLWANLENRVRGFASTCDTLYVITGPLFDSEDPAQRRYTEDNNGNSVVVPDGYFKVVMRYTLPDTYYSVAFVYDNMDYGRGNPDRSDMCSVSEVEDLSTISPRTKPLQSRLSANLSGGDSNRQTR